MSGPHPSTPLAATGPRPPPQSSTPVLATPHLPLQVDDSILDTLAIPPCATTHDRLTHGTRPETPLDFLLNLYSAPADTKAPTKPTHRRGRSSIEHEAIMDSGRPEVDPKIRGVPQGWEDDPDIPLSLPAAAAVSVNLGGQQSRPTQQQPRQQGRGQAGDKSQSPYGRLASFRETRIKLASFSAIMRERHRLLPPGQITEKSKVQSAGSVTARTKLTKSLSPQRPMPTRSSSLAAYPPPPAFPQSNKQRPAQSIMSESSITSITSSQSSFPVPSATDASTAEFTNLFTPSTSTPYPPSITSTGSSDSVSKRDRVMGLRTDPITFSHAGGSKVFLPPNVAEILPFASSRPFSSWDLPSAPTPQGNGIAGRSISYSGRRSGRRGSVTLSRMEETVEEGPGEGWKDLLRHRGATGGKRVWVDAGGEEVGMSYRVGWERDVLDLEARLHETMFNVAGQRHTFVDYKEGEYPKTVLDIGTGTGLWPISQALIWPETAFVGLDLVPIQTNLGVLASAERRARSTSDGVAPGEGVWEGVARRITWDRGNFLETLPYDTGVFDMVHLRFLALGVPEAKWSDLLDECARVLKPGGRLEIVETSLILPSTSPASLRNSFASMLLADLIEPVPSLALKFSIPLSGCFMSTGTTPVFERAWAQGEAPDALGDVVMGWVKSAMEYKGTGLRKGARQEGMVERVKRELEKAGGGRWRWSFGLEAEGKVGPDVTENEGRDVREVQKEGRVEEGQAEGVSVWAWVLTKR